MWIHPYAIPLLFMILMEMGYVVMRETVHIQFSLIIFCLAAAHFIIVNQHQAYVQM